ncbi:hypothetical protein N7478_003768 [Penicillium angulare]|uniref:uncharacterized protein n=1 Tax=Penicillium angulare TaxID=116970 RepID=UPI00254187E4|nr:uncharacterized protein N7478_003768 [Penicillium angulare]KAJ5288082.1 hypothetical protein N7478_003768 [Penicillium angulare]
MANLKQIPREIFDLIVEGLSPNSTKNMADALLFSESQENILWRAIFRNDEWINKASELGACPVLIGPTLDMIGIPSYKGSRRHHILLSANDWEGDLQYAKKLLFSSLRADYSYDEKKFKVTLPETRFLSPDKREMKIPEIVLYVRDAVRPGEVILLSKRAIRRLFEKSVVRTRYSFASQKEVRVLQRPDIYGIGGSISEPGGLLPICGMHPACGEKRWQTILQAAKCPRVRPLLSDGIRGNIVGWQRVLPHELR